MDELTQSPTRMRALVFLGVVFLLGMVSGASLFFLGQRSVEPRLPPRPPQAGPLGRLSQELQLEPDQRRAIRTILDTQRERLHEVLEDSRQEIRAALDPEQREQFDEMRPPRPDGPPPGFPPHPPPPRGRERRGGPPPPRGDRPPPPPPNN